MAIVFPYAGRTNISSNVGAGGCIKSGTDKVCCAGKSTQEGEIRATSTSGKRNGAGKDSGGIETSRYAKRWRRKAHSIPIFIGDSNKEEGGLTELEKIDGEEVKRIFIIQLECV